MTGDGRICHFSEKRLESFISCHATEVAHRFISSGARVGWFVVGEAEAFASASTTGRRESDAEPWRRRG